MSAQEYQDVYVIALNLFNAHAHGQQKPYELDEFEKIIADRNSKVFRFDPFSNTYSFIDQQMLQHVIIPPFLRRAAERDFDYLKDAAVPLARKKMLERFIVAPYALLEPSSLLMFNRSKEKHGLQEKLNSLNSSQLRPVGLSDITPGTQLIYRKKDGSIYRIAVLAQAQDGKFDVCLLDFMKVNSVRQNRLFCMPKEVDVSSIPCSAFVARLRGVKSFKRSLCSEIDSSIEKSVSDIKKRYTAVFYKLDVDNRWVIDFEAVEPYKNVTQSRAVKLIRGCYETDDEDIPELSYAELVNQKESVEDDSTASENETLKGDYNSADVKLQKCATSQIKMVLDIPKNSEKFLKVSKNEEVSKPVSSKIPLPPSCKVPSKISLPPQIVSKQRLKSKSSIKNHGDISYLSSVESETHFEKPEVKLDLGSSSGAFQDEFYDDETLNKTFSKLPGNLGDDDSEEEEDERKTFDVPPTPTICPQKPLSVNFSRTISRSSEPEEPRTTPVVPASAVEEHPTPSIFSSKPPPITASRTVSCTSEPDEPRKIPIIPAENLKTVSSDETMVGRKIGQSASSLAESDEVFAKTEKLNVLEATKKSIQQAIETNDQVLMLSEMTFLVKMVQRDTENAEEWKGCYEWANIMLSQC